MHIPVLLQETLQYLDPKPKEKYIDATIGGGGHARAILERGGIVLGIDRDPIAIENLRGRIATELLAVGNFGNLRETAEYQGFTEIDGILFDLGLGSHQLDAPERGFSFQKSGPLDMRFDQTAAKTAEMVVNNYPEKDLLKIFRQFGEEYRFAKRIARAILETRKHKPIRTTDELFETIKKTLPGKFRFKAGDTARKIFQSIRIEVNGELENLEKALPQALQLLKRGGKLVVISFHSLEDRIVKRFLLNEAKGCVCPPEFPVCQCGKNPSLLVLTKKPITASPNEIEANPRARSAKLRAARKL